jgi:hypothetical protein
MSHYNGYHMSTLLLHLDIPNNDLAVMLQKIIDVAVGIVVEAGTSRMQQSIDVLITYTTTECIVIQLPDSIPTIESSIDAFENVNTMDTITVYHCIDRWLPWRIIKAVLCADILCRHIEYEN